MKNIIYKIESWILNVIADNSWQQFNDIHIDDIDIAYKDKKKWIEGGMSCFNMSVELIRDLNLPFIITLSLALKSKKTAINTVKSIADIQAELDDTPPSLYVFHKDWKGYNFSNSVKLDLHIEGVNGVFYYFQNYDRGDKDYRRFVIILSDKNFSRNYLGKR